MGGIITEYYEPHWAFYWYAWYSLIIGVFACFLSKECEKDQMEFVTDARVSESEFSSGQENYVEQQVMIGVPRHQVKPRDGFCYNIGYNCKQIGRAIGMREIYFVVIFFLIKGFLNPTFEDFTYYFLLNEIHISKFIYAMLVLVA